MEWSNLIGIFIIIAIIKGVKYFFFSATPSTTINPFEKVRIKPLKPKVHDRKQRDAVLKQSFAPSKVPDNLDAIVIGSGIGGLTTAAIMSASEKKVLVLEQHDQAGGCCHSFIDKGYEFDVGIHYIGTMEYQSMTKTIVDQITGGQLTWEPLDKTYDEVIFAETDKPVRKYSVMYDHTTWKNYLQQKFPDEKENLEKFFVLVRETVKSTNSSVIVKVFPLMLVQIAEKLGLLNLFTNYWKYNNRTTKEVVDEMIKSQELRDILCYCFGDYGTVPSKSGFPMQALLLNHFLDKGGSYPVGGASEIAFNIIPEIESGGGKVLVKAAVTKILCDSDGKACGVEVKKGDKLYEVKAPIVISAAGYYNTFKKLLPIEVAKKSRYWGLDTLLTGSGAMSAFIGIDCPAEKLDILNKRNAWVFTVNDIDKACNDYLNLTRDEALEVDVPLLFVSFPSTKDPEWELRYPGKTTLAIITLANYDWFKDWEKEPCTRRSDEYSVFKNIIGQKMLDQVTDLFPSIKDHIDYINIGSPLSNNYYLNSVKGEIYGLDHTAERFNPYYTSALRSTTDVPGLFLSGQDVVGCGFVGGLMGGVLGASAALSRNLFMDLPNLHKQVKDLHKKK